MGLMVKGATLFPSALNYGSTWNPDLIEAVAREIAKEAKQIGCHQGLAPVLDVSRDVRWGRTEETMGEDPYLVGVLGTRYVRTLQGENREFLATLKHFVGHSFSEGARNHAPVHLGFKELNDIFMLPFEMAVKQANAGSVMPAYHDIDNEPCHASRFSSACLKTHLRAKVMLASDPAPREISQKRWLCNRSFCWKTTEFCLLTPQKNPSLHCFSPIQPITKVFGRQSFTRFKEERERHHAEAAEERGFGEKMERITQRPLRNAV
jgi:hypothetical protein